MPFGFAEHGIITRTGSQEGKPSLRGPSALTELFTAGVKEKTLGVAGQEVHLL